MTSRTIELLISKNPVPYDKALRYMETKTAEIIEHNLVGAIWFLEHPSVYTAGTSSNDNDLINADKFPVYKTGRGGKYTYHGPGQRIVYLMLNLKLIQETQDVKLFVANIQNWLIATLGDLNIKGEIRDGRIGIWVKNKDSESKIAAIGIRLKKWVSYHGIALNINPNLDHYDGIVPCGIKEYGITSIIDQGIKTDIDTIDQALKNNFEKTFNLKLTNLNEIKP